MKNLLKALPIVLLSSLAGNSAQAEIEHETKKSIALVSSGIIGGILGGPLGFIAAGVGGALVVDAVFDENSLPEKAPPQAIAQQLTPEIMGSESSTDDPFADDFGERTSSTDLATITDSDTEITSPETNDSEASNGQAVSLTANSIDSGVQLSLLFDTNQDQLSYDMLDTIDGVKEAIKQESNSLIRINGYADARGSEAFNEDLAYRRAESVANYLVDQGIDRDRIIMRSMGESQSSPDSDAIALAKDRRVDLQLDRSLTASNATSCDDTNTAMNGSCEAVDQAEVLGQNLAELDEGLAQSH
jgi:outer membrane protein OmpA-like peptidoglycan-associated protein